MVVADLHVHTTSSDGTLALADVPGAANSAGLRAVAVTDHDRLNDDIPGPVVQVDGVTLIHGIELRVETDEQRVDLLGYGARATDALEDEIERIQANRIERGRRILDCVEDRLGVTLEADPGEGFGRPHVARAVADHPETGYEYGAVFDELIGEDGPCYVARAVPSFERGRDLLTEACRLVALAHPLRYDDPKRALSRCGGLGGVELHYPYGGPVNTGPVERAIAEHDLVPTGGSDAHEETLGLTGLSSEEYDRVRRRLESV